MKSACSVVASVFAGLFIGFSAPADIILIDFGSTAPVGAAGGGPISSPDANGNTWNNYALTANANATGGSNDLVYVNGVNSTFDLTLSGPSGFGVNPWNGGLTPSPTLNGGLFAFTNATDDGLFALAGVTGTIALTNLNPTYTYNLTFYGARTNAEVRWTTYAVQGGSSVSLQTSGNNLTQGWNADTVVSINGITPVDSAIVFTMRGSANSDGSGANRIAYLNALMVEAVPEPGSFALVLLGGALLLRGLRRGQG